MSSGPSASAGHPEPAAGAVGAADPVSAAALARGLPGGIAVSRLRVYDWQASDGLRGGSPHLHTASTEGYVVLAGTGEVETVSSQGMQRTPLTPGTVAWFTPGTVHRLINADGELDILTLMSNAGLPEAGDAVLTFPLDVLRDPYQYREKATLPADADDAALAEAARARRDLALAGFFELRERAAADLEGTLHSIYMVSASLVATRTDAWSDIVAAGPGAQLEATAAQLASLAAGDPGAMAASGIAFRRPDAAARWGMCGRLTTWSPSAH